MAVQQPGSSSAWLLGDRTVGFAPLLIVALLIWALGSALLLGAGASYSTVWLNDQFGLVASGHRVAVGQVPSIDFRSIYGVFTYLPIAAALQLGYTPGLALPIGHVIFTALLALLAAATLARRYGLLVALVVLAAVETLALAPIVMGRSPLDALSFGVFYNRHGWALLAVALLHFVDPRDPRRRDVLLDGGVLATLLVLLGYSVFNFAVIAAGFVLANAFTSAHKARVGAVVALICLIVAGLVELTLPGYHTAYLAQLFPASGPVSQSTPGVNRILGALLHQGMTDAALCVAAGLACAWASRRWLVASGFVIGALLGCVVLSTQTGAGTVGMPALIGAVASLAELTRRGLRHHQDSADQRSALPALAIGLVLIAAAQPVTLQSLALLYHYRGASQVDPAQAALTPPAALAGFRIGAWVDEPIGETLGYSGANAGKTARIRRETKLTLSSGTYYATVVEGMRLLALHIGNDGRPSMSPPLRPGPPASHSASLPPQLRPRLIVFDKVDPFTFALGLRPTCYGIPLFWADRIGDPKRAPPATELFADADLVMVPRAPYDQAQLDALNRFYGQHLRTHFRPIANSPRWQLWRRARFAPRPCPNANPTGPPR